MGIVLGYNVDVENIRLHTFRDIIHGLEHERHIDHKH